MTAFFHLRRYAGGPLNGKLINYLSKSELVKVRIAIQEWKAGKNLQTYPYRLASRAIEGVTSVSEYAYSHKTRLRE